MKWHGGIHGAESAVLRFEALKREKTKARALKKLLAPITAREVERINRSAGTNVWGFIDNLCGLTRRLESAAWVYEGQNRLEIVRAHAILQKAVVVLKRKKFNG